MPALRRKGLGVLAVGSKTSSRNMHFVRSEEEWSGRADLEEIAKIAGIAKIAEIEIPRAASTLLRSNCQLLPHKS
jgi:hypothetical protein